MLAVGSVAACQSGDDGGGTDTAASGPPNIAMSNSYDGNFYRQTMVKAWDLAVADATKQQLVGKNTVVNADNTANTQISQIQSMLVQDWNAIVINAASATALNGVIQKACDQGIKVVVYDSVTTSPCAYQVAFDYVALGKQEAEWVAKKLNGKGNILEIRGIAGTSVGDDIHKGIQEAFAAYPDIKIVGEVHGNWTKSVAQQAVAGILPSLPQVDAVVTQGGDGTGAALAFQAANRKLPVIIMGNRGDELRFWQEQSASGYETISSSSAPGISSIAFWIAYLLTQGTEMPKSIPGPLISILTLGDAKKWIEATPPEGVATPVYNLDYAKKLVEAANNKTAVPDSPLPGDPGYIGVYS
ncbi:substrate-binding domain-containing protein [Phytohabitans flavus]|uniref:substrate-binding domain-containing protein n=1 Tax=Phytohabitans flavus TaxID=1076124 RepID=UPI003643D066